MSIERRTRAFPFVLAFAALGCASFSAPIDRTVTRGAVTTRLETASGLNDKEPRVSIVVERVPEGVKLLQASVRTDADTFCDGVQATKLSRSGAPRAADPLRPGERIVFEFHAGALTPLSAPGPRLDLLIESAKGTRRCIPLELTEGRTKLEWDYDQRFTLGGDLGVEAYTTGVGPVSYLAGFVGTFGAWVDRFRFELGAGIGGAGCPADYCEPGDAQGNADESRVFPFHLGVQTPFYETSFLSFGLGARYRIVKLRADTREGEQSFWAHGPLAAPYVAIVTPPGDNQLGGSRLGMLGVELPVGYAMAETGEQSVSFGFNLRIFVTVL